MELPTETWRTSSGAGCNTPAPAARRKPSRWAGTTRAERGLRLAPQSRRGGDSPGVDAQQVNRRRGTQRTNREEGPIWTVRRFGECTVDCRKEGARSHLPRGQGRETGRAGAATARDESSRAGGKPPRRPTVPPDVRGNPLHRPGVRRGLRLEADRRSGSSLPGAPREPAGTRKNPQQEGARSRDRLRRGGAAAQTAAGTVRASDRRATDRPRPRSRLDPPGRGRKRRTSS